VWGISSELDKLATFVVVVTYPRHTPGQVGAPRRPNLSPLVRPFLPVAALVGTAAFVGCGPKYVQLGENRPAYTRESGRNLGARMVTDHTVDITPLKQVADSYLGVPYVWGGTSTTGIDCSGFTQAVWKRTFGFDLPRVAKQQSALGYPVFKSGLQPGDMVFFGLSSDSVAIDHVGIYMGNNKFINATVSGGVKYSSLDETFWLNKYQFARRFPNLKLMLDSAKRIGVGTGLQAGKAIETNTPDSYYTGGLQENTAPAYTPSANPRAP